MGRRLIATAVVVGAGIVACTFSPKEATTGDDVLPDAGDCTAATAACIGDVLRTCGAAGETAVDTTCTWGCLDAHCARLLPGGSGVTIDDADAKTFGALADLTFTNATIDGTNGQIDGASPAGMQFLTRGANDSIAVFRFAKLRLSGTITLVGSRPIVLVATDGITIDGAVTAMSCGGSGEKPGPGGFAGGSTLAASATGSGAGTGGDGGGGGGNGGTGGASGNDVAGGAAFADDVLVGGGGGGAGSGGMANFGRGGGGGGAVQLVANTQIDFADTGSINAGGCGGSRGGGGNDDGGGGGAGGTIVLEAPSISIAGILAVNGGGGGGAGGMSATDGSDGLLARSAAAGGSSNGGAADEGSGGAGGAATSLTGTRPLPATKSGGGGGGVGRIRIRTRIGVGGFTLAGQLSPEPGDTPTTATITVAPVQ